MDNQYSVWDFSREETLGLAAPPGLDCDEPVYVSGLNQRCFGSDLRLGTGMSCQKVKHCCEEKLDTETGSPDSRTASSMIPVPLGDAVIHAMH